MLSDKMLYTRRVASDAVMLVLALVFSYIEAILPLELLLPLPGFKLGLANIVITVLVWRISLVDAAVVSALRVLIMGLLFGSPVSMIYSLAGAVLSLAVMFLLKKLTPLTEVVVSVCGGVMHNVAQIAVASVILDTNVVVYYLPFLVLSGTLAGIAVGVAGALLIKRVKF